MPSSASAGLVPAGRQLACYRETALPQYPRGRNIMGYSMRTDRYRFTRWLQADGTEIATELYDHHNDPQENVNIAAAPENVSVVEQLTQQLKAGWRAERR